MCVCVLTTPCCTSQPPNLLCPDFIPAAAACAQGLAGFGGSEDGGEDKQVQSEQGLDDAILMQVCCCWGTGGALRRWSLPLPVAVLILCQPS